MKVVHTVNIIYEVPQKDIDQGQAMDIYQLYYAFQSGKAVFKEYIEAGTEARPTFVFEYDGEIERVNI